MQHLAKFAANRSVVENFPAVYRNDPITFIGDPTTSRMFQDHPNPSIYEDDTKDLTYNNHDYGIGINKFYAMPGLYNNLNPISTAIDSNNAVYISAFEYKNYPFYGVQFHPEKAQSVFKDGTYNFRHGKERVEANSYFASFFVNECRKNGRHFSSHSEVTQKLIQNYDKVVTTGYYGTVYVFNNYV